MFHHLTQLLSQFCQFPISPVRTQNQAEGGTTKIKVNPTEVRQEVGLPVGLLCYKIPLKPKVMMTEETVYEEQQQCRHVNQKSCFNAYKTVYKTAQVRITTIIP